MGTEVNSVRTKPLSSVMVAFVQVVGGVVFACLGALLLRGTITQVHVNRAAGFVATSPSSASFAFSFGLVPMCFGLLSAATGVGLFLLHEWARKATLFLATVPVLTFAVLILVNPSWIFPRPGPYEQYGLLTIGSGIFYLVYLYALLLLVPISIWWLALFTRPRAISQFKRRDRGPNEQPALAEPQWFWVFVTIDSFIVLVALLVGFTRRV